MNAVYRLYSKENTTISKSINIDDSLYEQLKQVIDKEFDATISQVVNVALENYVNNDKSYYYAKPDGESVTYRSIMIRKENLVALQGLHFSTGISFTRLVNSAIKYFLDNLKSYNL